MSAYLRILGLHRNLKTAYLVALGIIVAAGPLATAQNPVNTETTANTYKTNCATCHADDGSGTALGKRLHVKDLRTKEVQEKPSSELAQTIGAGKDNMPAFGNRLDDDQIQKLVDYIRHKAPKSQ
jgi:mono/diheme cytochrome c family protein